jgi:antitoxin (DNA-binding transcriptional repressor) of toxin-antitoxin stability system
VTGARRPWLWALPARVELADGAEIRFRAAGEDLLDVYQAQIDRLFEIGLMQPPRTTERDRVAPVAVTLTGDARFLIGAVDLGRDVGLEVLVRGLEVAVDVAAREYLDRHPGPDIVEDDVSDDSVPYEPDDTGSADTREIQVPVDQAGDRMPNLLEELARGARVVLVDQGVRVAVLTTWSSYVELREKLAAASVAFWTAWRTGVFDIAGYATDIITVLHRPDTAPRNSDDDAEDGDRDEPEP